MNAFGIAFVVVAVAASIFYGAFAHDIHVWPNKADQPRPMRLAYRVHQFWFNFVGSVSGWLALLKVGDLVDRGEFATRWGDLGLSLVALLGITGYLPLTLYTFAAYGGEKLRQKANEAAAGGGK
ncbi:MAG: hypothetical protein HZB56_07905 [Deltaproteobacteria bacterium]|nr:hypothetical protein [Deltaproteobacteria bacterium]